MGGKEVKEQRDFDILNKMKKLPGGLVIIPLVIAVLLATFVPQVFQIGGYVTALFYEGNACMMGFFLIVCGSTINIKQVGMPLYKRCCAYRNQIPVRCCVWVDCRKNLRTGRISWDYTVCNDCGYHKLQWIAIHITVFAVWKCNRYRSDFDFVIE